MIIPNNRATPKPHDGPLRWLIPSRSQPGENHLVELDAYKGNGRCSCPDFTCRHEPVLRREPAAGGVDKTRCKHIRQVRAHFLDSIIAELAKGAKALLLVACATLQAEPTDAFLDALAWAETRGQNVDGDGGEAVGVFQLHRAAWMEADAARQRAGLPRATYPDGARCPAMARRYACTLLTIHEGRLRRLGLEPTAERLWLAWTMGWTGAKRINFTAARAPAYKQRGLHRLQAALRGAAIIK